MFNLRQTGKSQNVRITSKWKLTNCVNKAGTLLQQEDTVEPNMKTPSVWWGNSPDCFLISLVDHMTRWASSVICHCVCEYVCVIVYAYVCVYAFLKRGDLTVAMVVPDYVITPT